MQILELLKKNFEFILFSKIDGPSDNAGWWTAWWGDNKNKAEVLKDIDISIDEKKQKILEVILNFEKMKVLWRTSIKNVNTGSLYAHFCFW